MALLTRKQSTPRVPDPLDARPRWREHEARVSVLRSRAEEAARAVADLERQQREAAAALGEAEIALALGEDEAAEARVTATKQTLATIDAQLEAFREQARIQRAAVERVEARGPALRAELARELDSEIAETYRALNVALLQKVREMEPIANTLAWLRRAHGGSAALRDVVWIDPDLVPRTADSGLPNRMAAWVQALQRAGIR